MFVSLPLSTFTFKNKGKVILKNSRKGKRCWQKCKKSAAIKG